MPIFYKHHRCLEKNTKSNRKISVRSICTGFLVIFLITGNLLFTIPSSRPVSAQSSIVTVTADQPNIWTLEQAHYLLAQMRRRNLDLKAKVLSPLDANEINGINIDVLRTLLEVGATYDEAGKFNNGLIKNDKNFNAERRRQLIGEISSLETESVNLAVTIAGLKREKVTAGEDRQEAIEALIVENTEIKAAKDAQIESKRAELSTLSSAGGNVTGISSSAKFDASKFPSGGFDETFRKKAAEIIDGFKTNPQLNASLQLDNFLQLQYEIISKQLTLLRDEVGPGERLIFLELPQSVNAAFDKSDDMWAQSRWRIRGFTRCGLEINKQSVPCNKILDSNNRNQNRPSRSTLDIFDSITGNQVSLFDKMKLTLMSVKDREKIAKAFLRRNDKDSKLLSSLFALSKDAEDLKLAPEIEESEKSYQKSMNDLTPAEDYLELINKSLMSEFRECKEDLECVKKIRETKENAEKRVREVKESIKSPPVILLNHILKTLNHLIEKSPYLLSEQHLDNTPSRRALLLGQIKSPDNETQKLLNRLWIEDIFSDGLYGLREEDFSSEFIDLSDPRGVGSKVKIQVNNRIVRTVEMIPRQSSFNVNDVKIRNSAGAFNFIASFLFGFGANVNYQRQREKYSQFVQQELYSSAFGKGSREFGWTFTSMPGTDKLLSGLRTTYAIVVVPQEATSVVLESTGCAFNRDARQPINFTEATNSEWRKNSKNHCSEQKNFVVPIPGGGFDASNDFFVSGLSFEPVEKGKRVVLSIYGSNFSSQIGVMINGVSLPESIGLAQRFLPDDSVVGKAVYEDFTKEKRVIGGFERVDANQIIASFELIDGKDGNPVITLLSPGKAVDLNSLDLNINGNWNVKLKDFDWIFGTKPATAVGIKDTQVFVSGKVGETITELTFLITGKNLSSVSQAFVNGIDPNENSGSRYYVGSSVYRIKIKPPNEEKMDIVLVSNDETIKLASLNNPAQTKTTKEPASFAENFKVTMANVIAYWNDAKKEKINDIVVKLTGEDLKDSLNLSIGQYDFRGKNAEGAIEAYITIPNPKPVQTIRITDTKRNVYFNLVVTMSDIKENIVPLTPSPTPRTAP